LSRDFKGNLAWDIFFGKTAADTSYTSLTTGGTEIMVWASHPGIGVGSWYAGNRVLHVRLGKRNWQVLWATAARHGWNYIAFVAPSTKTGKIAMHNVDLSLLINYVMTHMHLLKPTYWLASIDFGTEVYSGGAGTTVTEGLVANQYRVSHTLAS
jgi:hypothetical protein